MNLEHTVGSLMFEDGLMTPLVGLNFVPTVKMHSKLKNTRQKKTKKTKKKYFLNQGLMIKRNVNMTKRTIKTRKTKIIYIK